MTSIASVLVLLELLAAQYLSTIQGHGVKTLIGVRSNGQGHVCGAVKQPTKRIVKIF